MQVRDGTPDDRDSIISLDPIAHSDVNRVEFIEHALQSEACMVADHNGSVVGYAVLEYTFFGHGFVSMLYVAEPARRRGIGRALMREIERHCMTPKLFTSTNESNGPMQELLASLGYVPSGIIHNLDPGDPELVSFLDLTGRRLVPPADGSSMPSR